MANFGAYLDQRNDPPFEDWWSIKAIDHELKELSVELLELPEPLPPKLSQLSRVLDKAINRRHSEWESNP
jgi:hypothetical protein